MGPTTPCEPGNLLFHYDSVQDACVKVIQFCELLPHQPLMGFNFAFARFEDLGCVILEATHSWVLRELTNRNILGWVYTFSPGMVVVNGSTNIDIMQALNMLVNNIEQFNKDRGGASYFVERVVLTL